MNRPALLHHARPGAALALALLLAALPLVAEPPPPAAAEPAVSVGGAATPQALLDRLDAAVRAGDLGEIANCLAPEDRAEMVLGMLAATGMVIAFMGMGGDMAMGMAEGMAEAFSGEEGLSEEQRAEAEAAKGEVAAKAAALEARYKAILDRHGLADMLASEEAGAGGGPAELETMLTGVDQGALLTELMTLLEEMGDENEDADASGEMGIPLKGEIGNLVVDGPTATATAGDETLELVEIDGRWYLKAPDSGHEEGPEAEEADEH